MNMSEIKTGAGVVAFAIIGTAIVYGLLWAALGEQPTYGVRIISEPCTGIECVQPVMIIPNNAAPAIPQSDTIDTGFIEDLKASPCPSRLRIPLRTDGEAP